jgi:hypothetical protein
MDSPLDRVLPQFAHREVHTLVVSASPELVWSALHEPVLDRYVARGFGVVLDEAPRALAIAVAGQPWRPRGGKRIALPVDDAEVSEFEKPGFVLTAMSFGLEPLGGHGGGRTRLSTETRVQPAGAGAARTLRPYWLVIRAGSGLVRHELLRAVKRRAERASGQAAAGAKP